jgi:hypothetical protein
MRIRIFVAIVTADSSTAPGCSSDSDDPSDVDEQYVAAYNSRDIDAAMAVFTEESVVCGRPFSSDSADLTRIRTAETQDLVADASTDAYSISNVEVDSDPLSWDQAWVNTQAESHCQNGQTAVIRDGKILTWTWPSDESACP